MRRSAMSRGGAVAERSRRSLEESPDPMSHGSLRRVPRDDIARSPEPVCPLSLSDRVTPVLTSIGEPPWGAAASTTPVRDRVTRIQVSIVKYDKWCVATQFHRGAFDGRCAFGHQLLADRC